MLSTVGDSSERQILTTATQSKHCRICEEKYIPTIAHRTREFVKPISAGGKTSKVAFIPKYTQSSSGLGVSKLLLTG